MSNEIDSKVRKILKENVELEIPVENIEMKKELIEIGMNSLSYIKVIVAIEEEFGIAFDNESLIDHGSWTLESLRAYIENRIGEEHDL